MLALIAFGLDCIRPWLHSALIAFGLDAFGLDCIRPGCIRPPNAAGPGPMGPMGPMHGPGPRARGAAGAGSRMQSRPNASRPNAIKAECNQGQMQSSPNAIKANIIEYITNLVTYPAYPDFCSTLVTEFKSILPYGKSWKLILLKGWSNLNQFTSIYVIFTRYLVPITWYQVLDSTYLVPSTWRKLM